MLPRMLQHPLSSICLIELPNDDSFLSNTLLHISGEQYKWLERDLEMVDRTVTPWLIATWHPPWYSTYKAHYREAECMRVEMEELLYSYGVDIVFNGHVSLCCFCLCLDCSNSRYGFYQRKKTKS